MKFEYSSTSTFNKELKRLSKKYRSLKKDIAQLLEDIENNPDLGTDLGQGFRKIRLKITSKGKGKSGGGRVVTHNIIVSTSHRKIVMVILWDKSEIENVNTDILKTLL
ncbi:type II toxin-antitoxin system RelE/ParE family toxin [Sinomicrobium soli]|uniref:type II toxin-antitoxin system RelE/ParE family toxin n=1 Tax=Sinomicrobium sp. N-1-3-6 TaxID=2219864 RepID=UPI000DCB3A26|nr:type II toxin-antitoxin system RelE/ParE family toxin [Sinomicrobium sp. N-1-3-6]RAV27578.1 toxin [Sinomicrobium sp. N-1-3-6]